MDDTGGFSGVATEFLETIADDYTNIPVLLYCARGPGLNVSTRSQRPTISNSLHDAISFARLSAYCKLMVPIGLSSLTKSKNWKYTISHCMNLIYRKLCMISRLLTFYWSSSVYFIWIAFFSLFHKIYLTFLTYFYLDFHSRVWMKGKASRFLSIKDEKPYHSSAVYASAIHSISLPLRMEQLSPTADLSNASGAADMNEIIQMLAGQARQNMISTMDIAMPAPSLSGTLCSVIQILTSLWNYFFSTSRNT